MSTLQYWKRRLATEVLEREETMSAFARLVLALARDRETEPVTGG